MSTRKASGPLEDALGQLPAALRAKIITAYLELKKAALEGRFDAAGLNAGKLCEGVLRLLQKEILGTYTPFGKQLPNFADECRKVIGTSAPSVSESLRVLVPRALVFVYTMRSKRGIGHVGGDVDANVIDVATLTRVADWIICELVRVYHSLSLEEAQDIVDGLATREIPEIWEVDGKKRVLNPGLTKKTQTLLLLYSDPSSAVLIEDLCSWVEYANIAHYRRDVLRPMHKARLIEYDEEVGSVRLSPSGVKEVEDLRKRGAT